MCKASLIFSWTGMEVVSSTNFSFNQSCKQNCQTIPLQFRCLHFMRLCNQLKWKLRTLLKITFCWPFVKQRSTHNQMLTQRYCKNLDIKLVFVPYKIKNLFNATDALSKSSRPRVVYKFPFTGCNACCVGKTSQHLVAPVREHLTSDSNLHNFFGIFDGSETCVLRRLFLNTWHCLHAFSN